MQIPKFLVGVQPNQQAARLQAAVDKREISSAEATRIASELRFPQWKRFAHAEVGANAYGSSQQNSTTSKPLPSTSPLFLGTSRGKALEDTPLASKTMVSRREPELSVPRPSQAEFEVEMAKLAALVGDSTRIERVFGPGARVRAMNPQSDGDFYYTHEVARADGSKIQLGCRMSAEMRAKIALERFAIDNALDRLL